MRVKTVPIDDETKAILLAGRVVGKMYYLPAQQLERALYEKVNKVLVALGGKWMRSFKAHLFEEMPDVFDAIRIGLVVDKKKTYQLFETPDALAQRLIAWAGVTYDDYVLEPSAGLGAICRHLPNKHRITCVEIQQELCDKLVGVAPTKDKVICFDFLHLRLAQIGSFTKIVMNPPFAGNMDIGHVRHAFEFLLPRGVLVSVMSEHPFFAEDEHSRRFRVWFEQVKGESERLDLGDYALDKPRVLTYTVGN